ncbi:E3 ubiquitin-protein ligase rnf213-alpha-like [Chanos chanos]|uniref:RING-type E3 ubiquitin transferase n=1 Tax=Chanos chanos TaxID=29144 RepID=A0A6J2WM37_CHACN|nr:E3 ubiquitin-protein ligase rnf213-alpha-like [Chanos chanos]
MMKCPSCDHVAVEQNAKFCSQCGYKLSVPASASVKEKLPDPLVISQTGDTEMVEPKTDSTGLDSHLSTTSPKRPNEERNCNPKKKRKKKKKSKKKTTGQDCPVSLSSNLSDISLTETQMENDQEEAGSSESESSVCAMEETPDSLSDTSDQSKHQSNTSAEESVASQPENTTAAQTAPNSALTINTENTQLPVQEKAQDTVECAASQSKETHTLQTPLKSTPVPDVDSETTVSQEQNQRTDTCQQAHPKGNKGKKDRSNKLQAKADENANVDENANQSGLHDQEMNAHQDLQGRKSSFSGEGMMFGPQSRAEMKNKGSSVDPPVTVEKRQTQGSACETGDGSSGSESSESKTEKTSESSEGTKEHKDKKTPNRVPVSKQQIPSSERLTIYFHAVLSKDFKFDPQEDSIFIRAGGSLGDWKSDLTELSVSRDYGDHGYFVNGKLSTTTKAVSVSIPYKYIVYKKKKDKYEYEYIYKLDSTKTTNRCLFVKQHLLNEEGEWHQYDDIICAPPSTSLLKALKEKFLPEQRKSVLQGREIAGTIMLENIFDLLKSWTVQNFKSFLTQLKQFYEIYGKPFVYEETQKPWYSLEYNEKDVSNLLKQFMLAKVTQQLKKDGDGKSGFIEDPFKAALVMLYMWKQYTLKLDSGELAKLCTALCLPKSSKEEFLSFWTDTEQSFSCVKSLSEMVMLLMNTVKSRGMMHWIVVIPLFHLLKGMSKPFEPVSSMVNPRYEWSWAGLRGIESTSISTITPQDRRAMLKLMKSNGHLVEVDRLLPRSWMFLLTLDDLVECSSILAVDLLDLLFVFVIKSPAEISYSDFSSVSELIAHIQSCLLGQKYGCSNEDYGRECLAAALKLLEKICKAVKPPTYSRDYTTIPVACMSMVISVSVFAETHHGETTQGVGTLSQKTTDLLIDAKELVRTWIGQTFKAPLLNKSFASATPNLTPEIEMWNNIISFSFKSEDLTKEWKQTFARDFEGKFQQESSLDQIAIYCSKFEELNDSHPHVAGSIEKCALQAVTSICQAKSEGRLFERIGQFITGANRKFGKLVSIIIQKSWPRDDHGQFQDEQEVILQHLLNWTAAKNIFQLHGADEQLIEQLSDEAKERMAVATSSFVSISDQLIRGNIKIKLLKHILGRRDTFSELLNIECLCPNVHCKGISMRRLLQRRQEEVEAIQHEKDLVEVLLAMCRMLQEHVPVDLSQLEEKHHVDTEDMDLDAFMEVHPLDQLSSPMAGVVTYFDLDKDIKSMAEYLLTYKESYIFKMCWENQAKQLVQQSKDDCESEEEEEEEEPEQNVGVIATPDVVHDDIFQPCKERYKEIYASLRNGSIKLEDVDVIFKAYKSKYEELAEEIAIMCKLDPSDDRRWIQRKVQQIEQYHELHLAVESAQVVMMVKETLGLQGDFKALERLLEVSHISFQTECLDRIDNDLMQAKTVLVEITEARRLCLQELGLRKNFVMWVKEALEDINELKVFVDLASISAGENDLDVDRVACFHDAVLGYAPMLYELKPEAGFKALKEVLKKLWKALDNDCNLPKKLRDTARHLEWLKTVKDSHGSVELSSLSLTSAINTKGIYVISAQNQKKLTLEKVLKLQIPEEHEEGCEMRNYSLEDLRELQNKLMLMSGKGDQGQCEVDQFAEVFASVQRLAVAFIHLFTAGNPLFRSWEANINCNSEEACIVMDFNLGEVVNVIMVEGNVVEQLPEVCKKMERCLNFWEDFMDKQRSRHYYLNYFTAEQIVYLCSQLTQKDLTNLEDQAFMLLSFVKPDCTHLDLRRTWHELQYKMLTNTPEQNDDLDFQTFVEVSIPSETNKDPEFDSSLYDMSSHFGKSTGAAKLDVIWNAYMRDMKNFFPSSLDIGSLGSLLEILANRHSELEDDEEEEDGNFSKRQRIIRRELPKGLAVGQPNLIVCPPVEILTSCISIYMNSQQEPLPTFDEVLLCNPSTPYEEVELFLRRCLTSGYKGSKIYTMLYVDQLTYEVSFRIEQFYQRHKMQSRSDFRLVLICSSDREHAYLPSAFSQFRLHMVPLQPVGNIQRYLTWHYTVPSDQSSAAAVFKDRLYVGLVSSRRAGVGKSLYIQRLYEKLKNSTKKPSHLKCIRLIEPRVDENVVLQALLNTPKEKELTIFHLDITSSVQKGLHEFLFRLLILGYLMDSEGRMWKCSNKHLYAIEILQTGRNWSRTESRPNTDVCSSFLDVFPSIFCRSPKEVLELEMRIREDPSLADMEDPLMDDQEFRSEAYQRPFQYLIRFHNGSSLDSFTFSGVEGTHVECLQMLFVYCGMTDPSWAELRNFAWFLNLQLRDCETSVFCDVSFIGDTLQGFKNFVVDFMILMAKDFATPSLSISDESPGRQQMDLSGVNEEDLAPFRIRKRWESEPHPYIFFNEDHMSMTFIGFHLQPNDQNGVDAIDPSTRRVIRKNIMTTQLYEGLKLQRAPFNIDFDQLPRGEKIERICNVLGIQWPLDPDETYELTTDNILKMLAIHMRFRCGIPVIIMGETGCGKTRLIKFLCELRRCGVATENMKLVKVHGGTSSDMIYTKVREAETIAYMNKQDYGFDSVLFFDEANTTEAISSIKEVLCDNSVEGERLMPHTGLQIIAACNPYRKHTDTMIKRLESAGLGYRVRAEDTDEKLGSIPLRQLVYRVQALPPSMIPLVWDFGQLNDQTEKMYIQQIVQRVVENHLIQEHYIRIITDVLSASQKYMRTRKDECSFVSLRDVERCMQVFVWFYKNHSMLLSELNMFERDQRFSTPRNPVLWSLVMAIGVCYHACLEDKDKYRKKISRYLPEAYNHGKLMQEISLMQDLLLSGVPLGDTIARNNALKENVFMMVICIELRIPLFLVGKPGSSKSLSKTLVADAMQGPAAHSDLFRKLKQIHLVSFQCSPHSTPEGIINTFKQCARFQEGKNLNEYISVVVLDEIGLAEDSPKMPLKTLHPLLEEGCIDDQPQPHKKVGFIGISNWALDPAKMNRGIFVSRGDPDETELIESAKGICSSDKMILDKVRDFFQPFARAYLNICKRQGKGFFGLRDYYSLIKMVFAIARASRQRPNAEQIVEAVLRNFSGKDNVNTVTVFIVRLQIKPNLESISAIELVRQNISAIGQDEDCRYLLVLTKNYAALQILQQTFFSDQHQPEIIFGSSFPKDQEYTQICRNINRVKICMETGQTIVLLNLQNLYESLYDALNQYYVCLGGQKYVDLGLGTHRVKCRVHKDFRLIVIEEKDIVYKQFPIPLINRLEKHYLDINTVLKKEQKEYVKELEKWVEQFICLNTQHSVAPQAHKYLPPDVFIGYHSDTCASVVLQVTERQKGGMDHSDSHRRLLDEAKLILLNCATPDAVVRLDSTALSRVESEELAKVYFEEQKHSSLADFILCSTQQEQCCHAHFTEVTTFSRLLTAADIVQLQEIVPNVELISLEQFDTEYSFLKKIRNFLDHTSGDTILLVQTDFDEASQSSNLIASAKYSAINEINKSRQMDDKVFVYFITKLPRMEGGTSYVGFHGGQWKSVHIDDLRRSKDIVSDIKALRSLTISELFEENGNEPDAMEVESMYEDTETHEMEQEGSTLSGRENAVDTTALVRSCVQNAVSMLRDQNEAGARSARRVEILLMLLNDNEELNASFLRTVKKRLHSLLLEHDKNSVSAKNWVFKEASNLDALQEGGTFRHTLWKRVQAVVVPFLAQLVSVIDRDCNLDLLLDANCGESVKKLWLEIFKNENFLNISYSRLEQNSESKTILVQNYIAAERNMGCIMPFSWRIKDHLEELWVHALQREGHSQRQFEDFFWRTALGRYIKADEEMQAEFFQRYLQDFVSMTMNVMSEVELQLLCGALNCCVNEMRVREEAMENDIISLPCIHLAYHEYKNRLQNLSRMITIEPQIAQVLLGNTYARQGVELVLDVYAAVACVEYLEPQALDTDAQCLAWLRKVKKLQVPIELICSEESVQHYGERSKAMVSRVQQGWSRIYSLSLFVEHMLLGIEDVERNLKPLVLEHTRGLGQVLEKNSDLKMKQPFEAVINILKACKDGANERIFRFGHQPCPVCMGEPQEPLSLPCDHIYCLACIKKWLIAGQMYCPLCMQPVPDDFDLMPSEKTRILISKNSQFRKQCNAFFINLVSTMCFKDNSPPSKAIILHLLSFLMVEPGSLPAIKGRDRRFLTKALSPFDDSVDKNPVVRSVVLKLLLKYSFDDVKGYLQHHLTAVEQSKIVEEKDKTELYSLYINCLEDSMYEMTQWHSQGEQQNRLQDETAFLLHFLQSGVVSAQIATVEHLQQVARVRLCLDMAADLLVTGDCTQEQTMPAVPEFLNSVVHLCQRSGNDWYRVYLIRKICSTWGIEFVQKLLDKADFRWMFPEEVLQDRQDGSQIDQFLVNGEHYKTIRDAVAKAMLEGKMEKIEEACASCTCLPLKKPVYLMLALFREVTSLYRAVSPNNHPKPEQCQKLEEFIKSSKVLASPEMKAFAQALVFNRLGPLHLQPDASGGEHVIVELTVHLAAVLLSGNQGVLVPLQQLAMSPANMQRSFIPTMPDDMLAIAQQALGQLQWYHCPNGHPCTVGECGQPMQVSRCPDCNAQIGGQDHRPLQGFTAVQLQGDRTQSGHILGDPSRRDNPDMQDTKNFSPAPFSLLRLLTHMAMLLGTSNHRQDIIQIIKSAVQDPGKFLMAHLLKDMEQLSRALGKGADDTVCTAHLTVSSLLEPYQPSQWPVPYDNFLSTKDSRNGWENAVNIDIVSPLLKNLERRLREVNTFVREDERVSSNPIMKLTFGEPSFFLRSLPQQSLIHSSTVWSCREKVSLVSLAHIVEQSDGKDTMPVLWRFLQKEPELRLVKFLPDILALQRDLVKKFQNMTDLTFSTIAEFIQGHKADSLTAWYEKRIKIFLLTWNQLRVSLATNGEIKLPGQFCKDLDLSSDIQVLLPRRQGLGLCSTALVSYLISLHNDLVYTMDRHTGEETNYTVSPADLTDLHVIRYEVERDLLPLVLSNCQYSMERGHETMIEYDLPKIQQQVLTRFLQGKPRITLNGIPTLVNRHDRNYENLFNDLKSKIEQESLPPLSQSALAGELQSYSDVCEALSTVELALGFLAMTGGEANMQLGRYLEDVLQMDDQKAPHVFKALGRSCLKHCVSLWQLLSCLKSETMLRLKRDPFVGISQEYKQVLREEERKHLTGFFTKASADTFILEMHEFLLLVLKNPHATDTFKPDWSLRDTVMSYMERKDLDVPPDVEEHFPEEILLSQYIEAWKFMVVLKQERNQR